MNFPDDIKTFDEATDWINMLDKSSFDSKKYEYVGIRLGEGSAYELVAFNNVTGEEKTIPIKGKQPAIIKKNSRLHYFYHKGSKAPVDFRVSYGDRTGCSHLFYKRGNSNSYYFLTSAHLFYGLDKGKVKVDFSIFGRDGIVEAQIDRFYKIGKDIPDVCVVKVDKEKIVKTFGKIDNVLLEKAIKIATHPPLGTLVGHADSLETIAGGSVVELVNVRLGEFNSTGEVDFTLKNLFAITDIATTGHSGAAIFTDDFSAVYGILLKDDDKFNFINLLHGYLDNITKSGNVGIDRVPPPDRAFRAPKTKSQGLVGYKPLEYLFQRGRIVDVVQLNDESYCQIQVLDPPSKFTILLKDKYSVGWSLKGLGQVKWDADKLNAALPDEYRAAELRDIFKAYNLTSLHSEEKLAKIIEKNRIKKYDTKKALIDLIAIDKNNLRAIIEADDDLLNRYHKMRRKYEPMSFWLKKASNHLHFIMVPTDLIARKVKEPHILALNCSTKKISINKTAGASDVQQRPCGTGTTINPCSPIDYYVLNDYGELEIWRTSGAVIYPGDKVVGEITAKAVADCNLNFKQRNYIEHDSQFQWL